MATLGLTRRLAGRPLTQTCTSLQLKQLWMLKHDRSGDRIGQHLVSANFRVIFVRVAHPSEVCLLCTPAELHTLRSHTFQVHH